MQTQNIEPKYLVLIGSNTSKKADFIFIFTDQDNNIKAIYRIFMA